MFAIGLFECVILIKNLVAIKRIGKLIETDDFRLMNWQLAIAAMYLFFLGVVISEAIFHAHLYNRSLSDETIDSQFVLKEMLVSYMCQNCFLFVCDFLILVTCKIYGSQPEELALPKTPNGKSPGKALFRKDTTNANVMLQTEADISLVVQDMTVVTESDMMPEDYSDSELNEQEQLFQRTVIRNLIDRGNLGAYRKLRDTVYNTSTVESVSVLEH